MIKELDYDRIKNFYNEIVVPYINHLEKEEKKEFNKYDLEYEIYYLITHSNKQRLFYLYDFLNKNKDLLKKYYNHLLEEDIINYFYKHKNEILIKDNIFNDTISYYKNYKNQFWDFIKRKLKIIKINYYGQEIILRNRYGQTAILRYYKPVALGYVFNISFNKKDFSFKENCKIYLFPNYYLFKIKNLNLETFNKNFIQKEKVIKIVHNPFVGNFFEENLFAIYYLFAKIFSEYKDNEKNAFAVKLFIGNEYRLDYFNFYFDNNFYKRYKNIIEETLKEIFLLNKDNFYLDYNLNQYLFIKPKNKYIHFISYSGSIHHAIANYYKTLYLNKVYKIKNINKIEFKNFI